MSLANKFGIPESLLDASKRMLEEANEYQKKVQAHMAKKGIKSLSDMTADQKKKFFNELDAMHTAKNEEVEPIEEAETAPNKDKNKLRVEVKAKPDSTKYHGHYEGKKYEVNVNKHHDQVDVHSHLSPEEVKKQNPHLGKKSANILSAHLKHYHKTQSKLDISSKHRGGQLYRDIHGGPNAHRLHYGHPYVKEEVEQVEEELKGEMHPDAHKVLKHIKPEHHGTYKPYLKKGTYKGDYKDRAAVLSAAERAGHVKEEFEDDQEDVELTLEDLEFIMQSEDFEQLDELSKNTLKSYVKKAEKNWQGHAEKQHGLESARSMLNQLSAGAPGGGKQHIRGTLPGSGTVNTERGHVGDNLKKHMPDVHKQMVKIHKKLQADRIETKRIMNKRSEGIRGAEKRIRKMRPATYKNEQVELTQEDLDFIASLNQIEEGSGPKEKQHDRYVDRDSEESKEKVKGARERMDSDEKAKAGKKLLDKIKLKKEDVSLDDFTVEEIEEYMQTEEFSQLDELSKETLGSYIKKRQHDVATQGALTRKHAMDSEAKKKETGGYTTKAVRDLDDKANRAFMKGWKHRQNIARAVDKIVNKA